MLLQRSEFTAALWAEQRGAAHALHWGWGCCFFSILQPHKRTHRDNYTHIRRDVRVLPERYCSEMLDTLFIFGLFLSRLFRTRYRTSCVVEWPIRYWQVGTYVAHGEVMDGRAFGTTKKTDARQCLLWFYACLWNRLFYILLITVERRLCGYLLSSCPFIHAVEKWQINTMRYKEGIWKSGWQSTFSLQKAQ